MSTVIDPSRIFTREQIERLLTATIGKLLHYKEVPVPTIKILSEFVQRIPVVGDIVRYPNLFVVGIVLNPASDTSRSFYLRRRVLHKKIDKFFCRDFNKY